MPGVLSYQASVVDRLWKGLQSTIASRKIDTIVGDCTSSITFSSDGNLRVSEIWDSREQFEAFGKRLMPILANAGVELAGEPEIFEVHNIIRR